MHRGTPFWSWNAEMTPKKSGRQVRELYEQGSEDSSFTLGMVWRLFILAENGWTVWKQRWMKQTAGHIGWLYDDDRWPSGNAGGMVAAGGDAYRLKGLTLQVCDTCDPGSMAGKNTWLQFFTALVQGDVIYFFERLENDMTKVPEPKRKNSTLDANRYFHFAFGNIGEK